MGCIYKFRGKNYTEDEFNNLLSKEFLNQSKTRVLYELQSDLFQKGRDRDSLTSKTIEVVGEEDFMSATGYGASTFEERDVDPKGNQFLQLLNKDNQWVTFFIKSIVQDSAKRGYEKVLFPTGNTASKIEGHTTLEEFKREKEDRIEKLSQEREKHIQKTSFNYHDIFAKADYEENIFIVDGSKTTKEKFEEFRQLGVENYDNEIAQLKQELERVEREGFGALRPIYKFYEETIGNILKKQYKDKINRITDEYGNQWWELNIDRNRDLSDILFQLPSNLPTEVTPEVYNQLERYLLDNKVIQKIC